MAQCWKPSTLVEGRFTQAYLVELDDEGMLEEIISTDCVSWGALANADEIVPDDVMFRHYDGVLFSSDDFSCTAGD